jgi:hypothetical protein
MPSIKSAWADPVWSKIIASAIIAAVGALASYFFHGWPLIGSVIGKGWLLVTATTAVPNGVLWPLIVVALSVAAILIVGIWRSIRPRGPVAPTWKDYLTDSLFDLRWRWRFIGNSGYPDHLYACCIKCDYQVVPGWQGSYGDPQIYYRCDMCDKEVGPFGDDLQHVESKVRRYIQQRVRTGSWVATLGQKA